MKLIGVVLAAAAATLAVPAMAADFTGPRIEATAGVDDVKNARDTTDITYGVTIGLDTQVGTSPVIVGVEASVDNVFDRRDIGAAARLGVRATDDVLLYGKAGYANFKDSFSRELDGLRVGGGVEFALTNELFAGVEYRYTDFQAGVGKHGAVARLGLRF